MKVKYVNAYVKPNGNKLIVITLDNEQTVFLNEGLVAYACQNAKPMKNKKDKKAE